MLHVDSASGFSSVESGQQVSSWGDNSSSSGLLWGKSGKGRSDLCRTQKIRSGPGHAAAKHFCPHAYDRRSQKSPRDDNPPPLSASFRPSHSADTLASGHYHADKGCSYDIVQIQPPAQISPASHPGLFSYRSYEQFLSPNFTAREQSNQTPFQPSFQPPFRNQAPDKHVCII